MLLSILFQCWWHRGGGREQGNNGEGTNSKEDDKDVKDGNDDNKDGKDQQYIAQRLSI